METPDKQCVVCGEWTPTGAGITFASGRYCSSCYINQDPDKEPPLTVDDVSPKAVRSAQLWLMGYLASTTDTNAEYDEWNHSDGWDLNLYHLDDTVRVSAYPFVDGETDYDRWVCVAEGTIPKHDTGTDMYEYGEHERCERCGTETTNGAGHFLDELGTEERICSECYKTEMSTRMGINNWVFTYADLVDQILGGK